MYTPASQHEKFLEAPGQGDGMVWGGNTKGIPSGGFWKALEKKIVGFTRFFTSEERLDFKEIESGISLGMKANAKSPFDPLGQIIP